MPKKPRWTAFFSKLLLLALSLLGSYLEFSCFFKRAQLLITFGISILETLLPHWDSNPHFSTVKILPLSYACPSHLHGKHITEFMPNKWLWWNPRGLANQKECTQALSLISQQTLNAFLHNLVITPFSHDALLYTHNPPLLICTPPFSHNHGVSKNTLFTPMALPLAQKLAKIKLTRNHGHQYSINHLIV